MKEYKNIQNKTQKNEQAITRESSQVNKRPNLQSPKRNIKPNEGPNLNRSPLKPSKDSIVPHTQRPLKT